VQLPPEWSEFLALLSVARVRFLVVGAHAVAVHGRPRATGDLDLFVEPTPTNAARLATALREFGFAELARETAAFAMPDRMVTLGRPPLRIDVMTSITGVSFEQAWRGRKVVRFGGRRVGVLGQPELERNKRAAGRPQDRLDLLLLAETRRSQRSRPPRR
jgi:hypothetical protein